MNTRQYQFVFLTVGVVIGAAMILLVRWPNENTALDPRLRGPMTSVRDEPYSEGPLNEKAIEALRGSSMSPEGVARLRASIADALATVDGADSALDTAVEYCLGSADGDIDRMVGLALEHEASAVNRSVIERYRVLADARPDRSRPRGVEHWNDVQVLRWATSTLTTLGRWDAVGYDDITATRVETEEEYDKYFDMTSPSAGVMIGYAPMMFGRPGLQEQFRAGEAACIALTVPATSVKGDRSIQEILLIEYEPGRWYPIGARVTYVESKRFKTERAPRPR